MNIILVGITGASGIIYGIRLLQVLSRVGGVETHLIISEAGERTLRYETDWDAAAVRALASRSYDIGDIGAAIASGSFRRDGMVIAPCSMKTLSALAHAYCDNLLTRAADVTLKERKKLILLARETPLHLGHLRNMVQVTEIGATVLPPVPSFYCRPKTVDEIVDQTVGRVLDLLGIENDIAPRWGGADG